MGLIRVGTPREAVEHMDRNLHLWVKGRKKFRGFLQRVGGEWRYVRLYKDENIIRYVEGGAMSIDTTVLHLLEEYQITKIDYHWGGKVYQTTVEEVYRYGINKPTGFQTAQYHLPLDRWRQARSYRRAWIPNVSEEIVQEESEYAAV